MYGNQGKWLRCLLHCQETSLGAFILHLQHTTNSRLTCRTPSRYQYQVAYMYVHCFHQIANQLMLHDLVMPLVRIALVVLLLTANVHFSKNIDNWLEASCTCNSCQA